MAQVAAYLMDTNKHEIERDFQRARNYYITGLYFNRAQQSIHQFCKEKGRLDNSVHIQKVRGTANNITFKALTSSRQD